MNAVGIDVSKGTSTVAILRPFGEIVASPFEVAHTDSELSKLAKMLESQTVTLVNLQYLSAVRHGNQFCECLCKSYQ